MTLEVRRLGDNKSCVLVSACLLGENCKYNGGNNSNQAVIDFVADKNVLAVCPEVAGGLPVPREPVELSCGRAYDKKGKCYDVAFHLGIQKILDLMTSKEISLAILQSRSPSCGVNEIYDGSFSGRKLQAHGLFAQRLKDSGYRICDAEDINELKGK